MNIWIEFRCAAFVRLVSRRKLHFSASGFVFELIFLLAHTSHRFHSSNRFCFCCELLSLVYFNCNCICHRVHICAFSIVLHLYSNSNQHSQIQYCVFTSNFLCFQLFSYECDCFYNRPHPKMAKISNNRSGIN